MFDTSNYDENKTGKWPLPIGKNKIVIGLFKDELGRKVKVEICAIRRKTYAYLMNDDSEMKKAKRAKKSALKCGLGLKVTKIACLTTKSY